MLMESQGTASYDTYEPEPERNRGEARTRGHACLIVIITFGAWAELKLREQAWKQNVKDKPRPSDCSGRGSGRRGDGGG